MESVLERLWTLANSDAAADSDAQAELVAEAQALWRALETLLGTLRSQDLSVGDPAFTKLLACVRTALSDPEYWRVRAAGNHDKGVFVVVSRVLAKLGCRGERERDALTRDGVVELLLTAARSQSDSAPAASAALQVLQTLAFDARNRAALDTADSLPCALALMQQHPRDAHVQLSGCKFLQLMVYDEASKETLARSGAVFAALDALRRFPADAQVAASALELVYFLSMELESSAELAPAADMQFADTVASILDCVLRTMHSHRHVEQVQANGVAILNTFVSRPHAKRVISEGAGGGGGSVWELVLGVLSCCCPPGAGGGGCDAASDAVELLDSLLSDPPTLECVEYTLTALSVNDHTKSATVQSLKTLRTKLESLSGIERAQHVSSRLESLLEAGGARLGTSSSDSSKSRDAELSLYQANRQLVPPESDFRPADHRCSSSAYAASSPPCAPDPTRLLVLREDDESEMPLATASGKRHYSAGTELTTAGSNRNAHARAHSSRSDEDLRAVKADARHASSSAGHSALLDLARHADDSPRFLDEMALDSETGGFFEQFLRDADNRFRSPGGGVTKSAVVERDAPVWRAMHESSAEEVQALRTQCHNLQENLKIVSRRAQEQAKLLSLQNSRIANHMEVHQHVLARVRVLEDALEAANRKCQVERELRSAEVAQCEKVTLALHDARREIKVLGSQNSSASRELMHKEKLRVDYQHKTSEIRHLKERIELERDDAEELVRLLEDSRREGLEALLMREEDVGAPKPRLFAEIGRSSPSSAARTRNALRGSACGTSSSEHPRRVSSCSPFAVQPIDTSAGTAAFSTYGGRGSPRRQSAFGSFERGDNKNADPETIERDDIEASLHEIFESLSTSIEGSGVHVSTVRRFFLESGIVQPPNVFAADVDVILAKVLNQSQESRRKVIVRRDYAFAQTAPPPAAFSAGETKKFRYFDQDAFNEAMTLVGMKRYPRFDVTRVLQTVVAEHLHPIQRRMRANTMLACTSGSSGGAAPVVSASVAGSNGSGTLHRRSSSTFSPTGASGSFCGSPGAISPSSACSIVMRTILNSLALHIGRGSDNQRISSGGVDADGSPNSGDVWGKPRRHSREDVVYSMLEMHSILAREQRPLGTICEFYSAIHHHQNAAARDELLGISFELVLNFAMDFEIVPSFMDRVSLKHLYAEVSGLIKAYLALQKRFPHATDAETLKKVAFLMVLARVAIDLFSAKVDFETPEKQVTGLLQWLDNSAGREKIMRKAMLPLVIKFSRKLYALKL